MHSKVSSKNWQRHFLSSLALRGVINHHLCCIMLYIPSCHFIDVFVIMEAYFLQVRDISLGDCYCYSEWTQARKSLQEILMSHHFLCTVQPLTIQDNDTPPLLMHMDGNPEYNLE